MNDILAKLDREKNVELRGNIRCKNTRPRLIGWLWPGSKRECRVVSAAAVPESVVTFRLHRCIPPLRSRKMDTFSKLKQFDAYPKTLEDFRVKTWGGATGKILNFRTEQPFIHSLLAAQLATRLTGSLLPKNCQNISNYRLDMLTRTITNQEHDENRHVWHLLFKSSR